MTKEEVMWSQMSERDILDFKEHVVWLALEETIEQRIELLRNLLEKGFVVQETVSDGRVAQITVPMTLEHYKKIQGEISAYRYLLDLPSKMAEEVKINGEKRKEGQNG